MQARARVVAEPDGRGGTRLARLRGEPPLLLRQQPGQAMATVYLLAGAAGPLGGDDLNLDITVRRGAALEIKSVAASMCLPGRDGQVSRMQVSVRVEEDALLHWLPEQLIAAACCQHLAASNVELAEGASLLWRDELVCGRHAQEPGDVTVATSITYGGRPLLRQAIRVGPSADGWAGPGVLGGAKATGSLIGVFPSPPDELSAISLAAARGPSTVPDPTAQLGLRGQWAAVRGQLAVSGMSARLDLPAPRAPAIEGIPPAVLGPTAVLVPLPGPGWLVTATAMDAASLRQVLMNGRPTR